ncbi:hypothetical protein FQA39_LY16218 [Lamprigera yunnana]|nr:hypothetical protein FQA39_LY16218 [Lamprigera yunnana]
MPDCNPSEEVRLLQYNNASNKVLVDVTRYALDGDVDKYMEMGYSTYLNLEPVTRIRDGYRDFGRGACQALLNKNSVLLTIEEWKTLMGLESYLAKQFFHDSIEINTYSSSRLGMMFPFEISVEPLLRMWMTYAEPYWTKAFDLRSAVKTLDGEFSAFEFDANHEAVYGLEKYYTVRKCEQLQDKYEKGRKIYTKFLQGLYSDSCLIVHLKNAGLEQS